LEDPVNNQEVARRLAVMLNADVKRYISLQSSQEEMWGRRELK
jgi:hypothetical protein